MVIRLQLRSSPELRTYTDVEYWAVEDESFLVIHLPTELVFHNIDNVLIMSVLDAPAATPA